MVQKAMFIIGFLVLFPLLLLLYCNVTNVKREKREYSKRPKCKTIKRKEMKSCFRFIHFFHSTPVYFILLGFHLQHKEGPCVALSLMKHKRETYAWFFN